MSGWVGKVVLGAVALGFVAAAVIAFRVSRARSRAGDAELQANRVLVQLGAGMAKCALNKMPATGKAVPARFADVAKATYTSSAQDWQASPFACAKYQLSEPQDMQYGWERLSETRGRVFAQGDFDGDGVPDTWFEVAVVCTRRDVCTAPNYLTEVLADGQREPPSILRWTGRAERELGEPPSLSPDAEPAAAPSAATSAEAAAAPVFPPAGSPASLDMIYLEAERRALQLMSGALLLSFEAKALTGAVVDPTSKASVKALYGQPDAKGAVARGAPVVEVAFTDHGLSATTTKAPRALHGLNVTDCSPERAFNTVHDGAPKSLTLQWDAQRERSLWLAEISKAKPRLLSTSSCATVK